ncbi:MAG: hypothetical protein FJZ11_02940 [Candidatus Omnitrophica bacterium]|nr:hypothetical protein [Candidatus Omnitrophota bacterium]
MNSFIPVLIILFIVILLTGCASANGFLLPSEEHIEHLNSVRLNYLDDPGWWNYSNVLKIKERVKSYLDSNPETKNEFKLALQELKIVKGMSKEEVFTVVGKPTKVSRENDGIELLIYEGKTDIDDVIGWYSEWGKLRFKNNILVDIEVRLVEVHK